jgi:hypothetical protein
MLLVPFRGSSRARGGGGALSGRTVEGAPQGEARIGFTRRHEDTKGPWRLARSAFSMWPRAEGVRGLPAALEVGASLRRARGFAQGMLCGFVASCELNRAAAAARRWGRCA